MCEGSSSICILSGSKLGPGFRLFRRCFIACLDQNAFLVALHGSTNKLIGRGYKIALMRNGERLQDFMTGFLQKGVVNGRPCDVLKLGPDSFLFTDDNKGIVYFVRRRRG
jgi:glucose/arabinose dehydrogenase